MYKHASLPGQMIDRSHPLTHGQRVRVDMHEGAGRRVNDMHDRSHGLLTGGASMLAGAAKFDGVNGYINHAAYPFVLGYTSPWSVSAWFAPDDIFTAASNQYPGILSWKSDGSDPYTIFISNTGGYDGLNFGSQTNWGRFRCSSSAALNKKVNHMVLTYNGAGTVTVGNFRCYINGVDQTIISGSAFGGAVLTSVIGSNATTIGYFLGRIWGVRLYARTLPIKDVQWLYAEPYAGLQTSRVSSLYRLAFLAAWAARANQIIGGSPT